jgi:NAD+ kinase
VLPITSKKLQLVVREPYSPPGKRPRVLRLLVASHDEVTVKSKMQDASMFLDGPYKRVGVSVGDVVVFRASDQPLRVLGLRSRRVTGLRSRRRAPGRTR